MTDSVVLGICRDCGSLKRILAMGLDGQVAESYWMCRITGKVTEGCAKCNDWSERP